MVTTPAHRTRAYLALAAICILWGTTYTAIKLAVRDFPPYLMVGLRQTAAGLLLMGWAAVTGKLKVPNRAYVGKMALTGLATITGGNGFITWGMQQVSSGLASVIGSLTPVVVVLITLFWQGAEKVSTRTLAGVLLGFAGLGIVFHDGWSDFLNPAYRWGIAGCFGSLLTWSLGTVMSKQYNDTSVSPITNAALQITAGGLGAFVLSLLFDKTHTIHHTFEGWASLIYLLFFGSALAFTLYLYALQHLSATVTSLYTYINPIVAIVLGWLLLGEKISPAVGVGVLVTLGGVYLVNSSHLDKLRARMRR
jgi:drug/metabolite transporter (DMT)-like permease